MRRRGYVPTISHKRFASGLDILVYVMSFASMFFTLDQARLIWLEHNAAGVSLPTWGIYFCSSTIWCLYGYAHKDKTIFYINGTWILIDGIVTLGILVYGM